VSRKPEQNIIDEVTEVLSCILKGTIPNKIDVSDYPDDGIKQLSEMVNNFIESFSKTRDYIVQLSQGILDNEIPTKYFLSSPFKQLQSNLRHLTWQAQEVAKGDFDQRVDFMGDFSKAFNSMVKELEKARTNLEQQIKDRTKELEKSYEEIRKNAEELRDLIDIAAHELRHPATVFRGYANILLEHWDSLEEETIKDALLKIDSATDRLTRIVVQFSDTSRIERGKMDLSYSETSPMALINNVFAEAQGKGYENELNIKPPEEHGGIEVDADKLKSVLGILLDNAVTYSPQGSAIDVWFEQDDRETVYYVADRGPGIPEADRERVFERFYQVEDAEHHSIPGIGLGLYIARSIVEAHGGWIKVEPRDGSGSVFSFGVSNSRRGDSGRG